MKLKKQSKPRTARRFASRNLDFSFRSKLKAKRPRRAWTLAARLEHRRIKSKKK